MSCQSLCGKLLRTKSLSEAKSMETPLDRCLSVWHLLFYGVAHMAGAGIYVLSGTLVKDIAGPGASLSFLLCCIASVFTGLCYVEFATLVPRAGSCYTFTYITLGELPAFVVGWTMVSDYIIGMASVAKAFSGTVDALSNHSVSGFVSWYVGDLPRWPALDRTWDVVAVVLILLLMLLVVAGAQVSLSVNVALSLAQICCLCAVAGGAFAYGSGANWSEGGGFLPFGLSGVLRGASVAIFALSGFESIANAAEESLDPRRDLPVALLGSLGVVSVLYVAVSLGLSYLQPYADVDVRAPFVVAFDSRGVRWAEAAAAAGTLLATGATKLATMYVIPRMLYALAADGIIWKAFADVNERVKVPLLGLFFGAGVSAALALVFNIETLADMVSMGVLLSYLAVGIDLLALRYLAPGQQPLARSWAQPLLLLSPFKRLLTRNGVVGLVAAYVAACAACAAVVDFLLPGVVGCCLLAAAFLLLLLLLLLLCSLAPADIDGCYQSPLMPLAPCVTILVNAVMLFKMQYQTWIRFCVWISAGLLVYLLYGMQHSKAAAAGPEYVSLDEGAASKSEAADETKAVLSDSPQ